MRMRTGCLSNRKYRLFRTLKAFGFNGEFQSVSIARVFTDIGLIVFRIMIQRPGVGVLPWRWGGGAKRRAHVGAFSGRGPMPMTNAGKVLRNGILANIVPNHFGGPLKPPRSAGMMAAACMMRCTA